MALVTGAASGIGRATTVRLAEEGAVVVALDLSEDGLALTKAACPDGSVVDTVVGDVTDRDLAPRVVDWVVERHGQLDVLANVAGILRTADTHEHPFEMWDRVVAVNLTGTFAFCRAALPALVRAGAASSACRPPQRWPARRGLRPTQRRRAGCSPSPGRSPSSTPRGVRCNAVCPGSIDTPITDDFAFPRVPTPS